MQALTAVAAALAAAGHTTAAERIARSTTDNNQRARALTAIAAALTAAGHTTAAERIGVEVLLNWNWVGTVATLVSLVIIRNGAARLMKSLTAWLDAERLLRPG